MQCCVCLRPGSSPLFSTKSPRNRGEPSSTTAGPRHPKQFAEKLKDATIAFRQSRQRHPGIESTIGSLQFGNSLKRCRDCSELGLERYVALAIVGRNLHSRIAS